MRFKEFLRENYDKSRLLSHNPKFKKVSLCSYCDKDHKEQNKWKSLGYDEISHGICPYHKKEQDDILDKMFS